MRYAMIPLLAGLVFSVLFFGSAEGQILHLDKEFVDFGTMDQHESRDTQITVTNKGGGILNITGVEADCGCTVPVLSKQQLAPGESTVIDVNFNSKAFNGNVTKMVHIFSNDPMNPDKTFFIQANVFSTLLVEPASQRVGFSQSPVGKTVTKMAIFSATTAPELIIEANKSRRGLFDISVINNYEGNPQHSALVVTIPKDIAGGRQRDNVRVKTNIDGHESVDIDISAWPVYALSTNVDKVNFRYKKDFSRSIHIKPNIDGLKFKITSVECDLPEVKAIVDERVVNEQTAIILSGSPIEKDDPRAQKKKGRITGTLTIHTNLEDLPVLTVPITYMIRM